MGNRDNMSRCRCGCVARTVTFTYWRITNATGERGYTSRYRPTHTPSDRVGAGTTCNVEHKRVSFPITARVWVELCETCAHRIHRANVSGAIVARSMPYHVWADERAGV